MLQTKTEAGAFFFFFELLGVSNLECGRNCVLRSYFIQKSSETTVHRGDDCTKSSIEFPTWKKW